MPWYANCSPGAEDDHVRRDARDAHRPAGSPVEFLTDVPDADVGDADARDADARDADAPAVATGRSYRVLGYALAVLIVLAGGADVLYHSGRAEDGRQATGSTTNSVSASLSAEAARPTAARSWQCPGADCPDSDVPEAGVIAAFTADVPGVTLASEHTVTVPARGGGRELVSRVLRMAFGDVDMTVTITLPGSGSQHPKLPAHAQVWRLTHGGYDFTISTVGLYPPTRRQLLALVADPRVLMIEV